MANTKRDPNKEVFWRDALQRHASSGLSVREFCRRNKLPETSFYERRRTFQERDARQPVTPAFVPIVVRDEPRIAHDLGIVIELRGGRVLRLPETMSAANIAELIHAIETTEAMA